MGLKGTKNGPRMSVLVCDFDHCAPWEAAFSHRVIIFIVYTNHTTTILALSSTGCLKLMAYYHLEKWALITEKAQTRKLPNGPRKNKCTVKLKDKADRYFSLRWKIAFSFDTKYAEFWNEKLGSFDSIFSILKIHLISDSKFLNCKLQNINEPLGIFENNFI